MATRVLNFFSDNIGQLVTLLLMFSPPPGGNLYTDEFPLAWEVIQLQGSGHSQATVTYTATTAFFVPQIVQGNLVTSSNSEICLVGQQCVAAYNQTVEVITNVTTGTPGLLTCTNETPVAADIGIGFTDPKGDNLQPALLWTRVGVNSSVAAQFTPTLLVYAETQYQQTQIIKGEIQSPLLLSQNLVLLNPQTTYNVTINATTGQIQLTQV
ncbi:hypothetical protein BDQ12DRAFT_728383 [Crucibulum laeve]|uniref:Uncharacterized protein n=1 Tax=Crucibulum laeve TaxID=68775 RepID=A0A5C3LI16_9AGAR|nr:hypothetical protein BDQ12DRAFT_728383 [Crucibulum laeve]